MQQLLDLIYRPLSEWEHHARPAFQAALKARYPRVGDITSPKSDEEKRFQLRLNAKADASPYVALLPPDQERSGAYGGMSFVIFPAEAPGEPALFGMVVGTNGLAPDEAILG